MSNDGERTPGQAPELEARFDGAMMEIYERAGEEVGYWATRYLQMLRRNGGLETARRLLRAKVTSDGYAHLREAGRLDLTVEAYALRPEFQPLFSVDELASARDRLGYFEQLGDPPPSKRITTDPKLVHLLEQAAAAAPDARIRFRDQVAGFGEPAIPALEAWMAEGRSIGFGCAVIEAIGRRGTPAPAIRALGRVRGRHPAWAAFAAAAIERVEEARRAGL